VVLEPVVLSMPGRYAFRNARMSLLTRSRSVTGTGLSALPRRMMSVVKLERTAICQIAHSRAGSVSL
jgi:hypothetical protein